MIWSKKVKKKNDEVGLGDEKTVDQKEAVPLRQYNSIGQGTVILKFMIFSKLTSFRAWTPMRQRCSNVIVI